MIMNVYFFTKENFWIGLNCFQNRVQSNFQTEYWNLNRNFCWATTNDFFFAVMSKSLVWRNTFRYQCEFSSCSILFRQFRCLLCCRRLAMFHPTVPQSSAIHFERQVAHSISVRFFFNMIALMALWDVSWDLAVEADLWPRLVAELDLRRITSDMTSLQYCL